MKMRAFQLVGDDVVGLEDQIAEFLSTGPGRPEVKVHFVASVDTCFTVWYEEESPRKTILDEPLDALELSYLVLNKLVNPMKRQGVEPISNVRQLVAKRADELLGYRGFGKKSLTHVREQLKAHGLRLKGD